MKKIEELALIIQDYVKIQNEKGVILFAENPTKDEKAYHNYGLAEFLTLAGYTKKKLPPEKVKKKTAKNTDKVNPFYIKVLDTLAEYLDEENIPYERCQIFDGEKIDINPYMDAVCHRYSYGAEQGYLEIQGGLTEEECNDDSILGYLTPEEVARRMIYCYRNKTSTYKEHKKWSCDYDE